MMSQSEIEAAQKAARERYDLHCRTFPTVNGAASLIELYGQVPSFHDSEVLDLKLSRKGSSAIRVSNPYPDIFSKGRVIVVFEIDDLIDVELDGFSAQNVLYGLTVCPLRPNPKREPYYARTPEIGAFQLEMEATWGVGGTLACGSLKVTWTKDRIARGPVRR